MKLFKGKTDAEKLEDASAKIEAAEAAQLEAETKAEAAESKVVDSEKKLTDANVVIEKSQKELDTIAEAKAEAAVEIKPAGNSAQESVKLAKANRKMVKFKGNGKNKALGISTHEVEESEAKMFAKVDWGEIV